MLVDLIIEVVSLVEGVLEGMEMMRLCGCRLDEEGEGVAVVEEVDEEEIGIGKEDLIVLEEDDGIGTEEVAWIVLDDGTTKEDEDIIELDWMVELGGLELIVEETIGP